MKFLTNFTNVTAVAALIYIVFQLVPNLLSAKDTLSVILGGLILVSLITAMIPYVIKVINKGKENE
jgi:hypothetical protein